MGTREVQSYTNSPNNIIITPSWTLQITPCVNNGRWTSARIEGSIKFGAGRPESQMGIWPSFWILGADFRRDYNSWPEVGEVDIGESINGVPTVWQVVHCGVAPGGPCKEFEGISKQTPMSRGEFHTVALEIDRTNADRYWRGEKLTFFVDGRQTTVIDGNRINDETAWVALTRGEKYLIANVAVGGE